MPENILITEHRLDFESAYWAGGWNVFRIGTCHGQWRYTPEAYEILSIVNDEPGNQFLNDVFQWFEFSCKRERLPLVIRELWNKDFKRHLIEKRGFQETGENDVIKYF